MICVCNELLGLAFILHSISCACFNQTALLTTEGYNFPDDYIRSRCRGRHEANNPLFVLNVDGRVKQNLNDMNNNSSSE